MEANQNGQVFHMYTQRQERANVILFGDVKISKRDPNLCTCERVLPSRFESGGETSTVTLAGLLIFQSGEPFLQQASAPAVCGSFNCRPKPRRARVLHVDEGLDG
jgi:hypothetical protein